MESIHDDITINYIITNFKSYNLLLLSQTNKKFNNLLEKILYNMKIKFYNNINIKFNYIINKTNKTNNINIKLLINN